MIDATHATELAKEFTRTLHTSGDTWKWGESTGQTLYLIVQCAFWMGEQSVTVDGVHVSREDLEGGAKKITVDLCRLQRGNLQGLSPEHAAWRSFMLNLRYGEFYVKGDITTVDGVFSLTLVRVVDVDEAR